MSKDQYVYFTFNNWEPGKYYPDAEPFREWVEHWFFRDDKWLKKNDLCVVEFLDDQSNSFRISARRSWVNKMCPNLLSKFSQFIEDEPFFENDKETEEPGYIEWNKKETGYHYYDLEKNEIIPYVYSDKDIRKFG